MLFLVQDGITNGAIYALLGLALVLVFAVTRVILIPQGEFVTFGALTYATLSARQHAGHRAAGGGDGRGGVRPRSVRRPPVAASARWSARAFAVNILLPLAIFALTYLARRPEDPDRGQYRAVAADRRGDRAVSLPHRLPAAGAHLGAGAADRLGRLPSRAAGPRPGVLRRRRPARPDPVGCGLHGRPAALHRPEHRGLRHHRRLHRRRCGCSSASRSTARRCAPPPSTGSARAWSASAPRCRDRSPSCSPP